MTATERHLEEIGWYSHQSEMQRGAEALEAGLVQEPPEPYSVEDIARIGSGLEGSFTALALKEFRADRNRTVLQVLRGGVFQKVLQVEPSALETFAGVVCTAQHLAGGMHTYEVARGLVERFKLTGTQGLASEDVRLPFAATMIQFPRGAIRALHRATLTDATGVLLHEVAGSDGSRLMELHLFGAAAFRLEARDKLLMSVVCEIRDDGRMLLPEKHLVVSQGKIGPLEQESTAAFLHALWGLLVNILMYATWPESGQIEEVVHNPVAAKLQEQMKKHPKGTHKYERARAALRNMPIYRRRVLGRRVSELPDGSGDPLKVRTLVQGHWQRFAIGPGKPQDRTGRKWAFCEPFWRGPVDAEVTPPRHHRMVD